MGSGRTLNFLEFEEKFSQQQLFQHTGNGAEEGHTQAGELRGARKFVTLNASVPAGG